MENNIKEFLTESNAIEGIYDKDSLQQALYAWNYLFEQKEITVGVILKTHKILMLNQDLKPNEKGYMRKIPIYIANREGIPWKIIPTRLATLSLNMRINSKNWKEHHIEFEKIHPFVDGNGRIGRMLMNWERIHCGLPILILKASERGEYYKWFK